MKKQILNIGKVLTRLELKQIKGSSGTEQCFVTCPNGAPQQSCQGIRCWTSGDRCYAIKVRNSIEQEEYVPCQLGISHLSPF